MKYLMTTLMAFFLMLAGPVLAQGEKTGFSTDSETTNGASGQSNGSTDNEGTTTTTTSGPKGQAGRDDPANTTTSTDEPGASK